MRRMAKSDAQKKDVLKVLAELGIEAGADSASERPMVEVLNKIDLLEPAIARGLLAGNRKDGPGPVAISARTGEGLPDLLARLAAVLGRSQVTVELRLDRTDGAGLAWAHEHGRVMAQRNGGRTMKLTVAVDRHELDRFLNHYGDSAHASGP